MNAFFSRGFSGRRQVPQELAERVPPGPYVEHDFPVLTAGPTPRIDPGDGGFRIDGMVADNLVYRTADSADRRGVLVHVAPRGSALYRRLSERIAAENGVIFGDVSSDQVAHLVESLAGFVARLR